MQKILLTIFLLTFFNVVRTQSNSINGFYVGHSLTDYIGEMVRGLASSDSEVDFNFSYQQILGSPLRWQWQAIHRQDYTNSPDGSIYSFYDPVNGLPSGNYSHLILTESVPRHNNEWGIEETYNYLDSFYLYAIQYNTQIKPYLYEVWHCINSGTPTGCSYDIDANPFRQRLTDDLSMWESAIDTFNLRNNPIHPIKLIPAGQAIGLFYDKIYNGEIQGISSINEVFEDDIHGNDTIRYLVACVHFATLFEKSPVGLTNELNNWWGGAFGPFSPSLAEQLQEIAWQTVCNYEPLGINCSESLSNKKNTKEVLSIFPNPTSDFLFVKFNKPQTSSDLRLYDLTGKKIKSIMSQNNTMEKMDLRDLNNGVYFLEIITDDHVFLEQINVR